MRWALLWSTSLLAACVVAPLDPLPSAVRAAEDGDLLRALAYLDQVPAMHPRHAAAQALAQALQALQAPGLHSSPPTIEGPDALSIELQ